MLGDAISFWAYSALRHVAMPAFPAMTLSLWAGSMAVRSAARYLSVRRCTAACGDACVSLAKANCAALLMLPRYQLKGLVLGAPAIGSTHTMHSSTAISSVLHELCAHSERFSWPP